jgi:porphobilinogen synthase
LIKARFPHVVVCTDVALDPYSDQGHDGVVDDDGTIANDITVTQLCKQAIMQVCI